MTEKFSYVYVLTNFNNKVLYIGMTTHLKKRVWEHKQKLVKGFTEKYNLTKLIYYEMFMSLEDAVSREKQLKSWNRKKKDDLIKNSNPQRRDLYIELESE